MASERQNWVDTMSRANPEFRLGLFASDDQVIDYYLRANSLLPEGGVVLDFGAGRGKNILDMPNDLIRSFMTFSARKAKLIALDVDDAVRDNPFAAETIVWDPTKRIPLEDGSIDLITTHWVLEHVETVQSFADEVYRLLRPGGWFCSRTVNKHSYIGWNRFVPTGKVRDLILRKVAGHEPSKDKFPVQFKLNTAQAIEKVFDRGRFDSHVFTRRSTQHYATTGGAYYLFRALNNAPFISKTDLIMFAQKKAS